MKRLFFRNRRVNPTAFTLVELLVVIAIIAILAGVTLNVGATVINAAKRAKAANTGTQIQTACLGYYTEYSVYPVPSSAAASTDYVITDSGATADAAWGSLIGSLCGMINPYNSTAVTASSSVPANTRSIAFLSLKSSDVDAAGAPLNPLPYKVSPTVTNNAFFNIAIDYDYDGILGGSSTSTGKLPNFVGAVNGTAPPLTGSSTAGVAVWANCNASATLQNPNFWVHTY